ncbi:MAG TPA: NAD(P)H-hydrate dehydratase [Ilumatobacter sp.]|nr:NAD(P)H-hydrate dehydratase [Ilumatobacter sp.]
MIPVVTPERMRAVDAASGEPLDVLVGRAGEAVARAAIELLGGTYGRTVTVFAGPGNNGADGRVAAERLATRGIRVHVFAADALPAVLPASDLVIDAAFGTGFRVDRVGTAPWNPPDVGRVPVLAVDIPSGLDGTTGVAAERTLAATATVTFGALKPGHLFGRGPDLCGTLHLAPIGLGPAIADVGGPAINAVEQSDVAAWVPARGRTDHKWVSAVRVVAGSPPMRGAASLCAAAAHRAGAGLVALSVPGDAHGGGPLAPVEAIDRAIPASGWADTVLADLHRFRALVVGPGLGRDDDTRTAIADLVTRSSLPIVVDGDGLAALPWNPEGSLAFLRERPGPVVLTPHDGEYTLLTGARPGPDRIAAAHRLSTLTGAVVLLKGPTTVVAEPGGATYLVTNGDERLATAGTGDVLSGVIAALLARGTSPAEAAAAGAWLHAAAAQAGPRHGLVASDLLLELPGVLP